MREMLNRALVLDTLADMGAITPRSTAELHANWRECFSIKNPRAKAPRDDDPEAGQLYMQFLEPAGEKAEEDSLQSHPAGAAAATVAARCVAALAATLKKSGTFGEDRRPRTRKKEKNLFTKSIPRKYPRCPKSPRRSRVGEHL